MSIFLLNGINGSAVSMWIIFQIFKLQNISVFQRLPVSNFSKLRGRAVSTFSIIARGLYSMSAF